MNLLLTYLMKTLDSIIEAVHSVNSINHIIISFIILIITGLIFSFRFQIVVNKINKEISTETYNVTRSKLPNGKNKVLKYHHALFYTVIGGIANMGGIGKLGIPAKAVLLKKHGFSTNTSIKSIAIDTTFDILFSISILIIAFFYIPSFTLIDILDIRIIAILFIIIIIILLKFRKDTYLLSWINDIKKIDYQTTFELSVLTLTAWILSSMSYYFIILSTNETVDLLNVLIIFNFSVVIGAISPIAGGIGVREAMLTYLSTTINIAPAKGLMIAIIYRILNIIGFFVLLIILKLNDKFCKKLI